MSDNLTAALVQLRDELDVIGKAISKQTDHDCEIHAFINQLGCRVEIYWPGVDFHVKHNFFEDPEDGDNDLPWERLKSFLISSSVYSFTHRHQFPSEV